ncbi:MAG TPA: hypothetical protein VII50_04135, partial [Acidothermaceae bacterium]
MGSLPAGLWKPFIRLDADRIRLHATSAPDTFAGEVAARVAFVRDALFPATEARRARNPILVAACYLLAAVAGFTVDLWWSGSGITSRVWAEDGTIFLSTAYRMPYLSALAHPYAGYLQVLPRSLAAFTTAFPVR